MSIYLCVKQREITTFSGSIYKFFYTVGQFKWNPGDQEMAIYTMCVNAGDGARGRQKLPH
jgi:hypothetical protein